jgi:hypothetical protein
MNRRRTRRRNKPTRNQLHHIATKSITNDTTVFSSTDLGLLRNRPGHLISAKLRYCAADQTHHTFALQFYTLDGETQIWQTPTYIASATEKVVNVSIPRQQQLTLNKNNVNIVKVVCAPELSTIIVSIDMIVRYSDTTGNQV